MLKATSCRVKGRLLEDKRRPFAKSLIPKRLPGCKVRSAWLPSYALLAVCVRAANACRQLCVKRGGAVRRIEKYSAIHYSS